MAIRVKKLARELRTTPEVVLSLLRELGYDRYKSEMDMVSDPPADKVRKRARKGLPAAPPAPRPVVAPPVPPPAAQDPTWLTDPSLADVPLDRLVTGGSAPVAQEELADLSDAVRSEQRRLDRRAQAQSDRESALNARMSELESAAAALRAERDTMKTELEQARRELADRAAALDAREAGGIPLGDLLARRGLVGADEHGRALSALARARLLDALTARLRVIDPGPVVGVLTDRLVLASGPVDELEGVAVVQVPPERAEVPGGADLQRARADLAGEFLLNGLTRVRLIGGGPVALRLLRSGVDERVVLELVPAASRDENGARDDITDRDAVVLWGVSETPEARAIYDAAVCLVIRVANHGFVALVQDIRRALDPDS